MKAATLRSFVLSVLPVTMSLRWLNSHHDQMIVPSLTSLHGKTESY